MSETYDRKEYEEINAGIPEEDLSDREINLQFVNL